MIHLIQKIIKKNKERKPLLDAKKSPHGLPEEAKDQHMVTDSSKIFHARDFDENTRCRICMDIGDDPNLEMCIPCQCTGSIRYVHTKCLKEWIKARQSVVCEICHKPYKNKWKIWAYENNLMKPAKVKNEETSVVCVDYCLKVAPIFLFIFIMFSIVAFSLNNKGINQENRFSFLMNFLRLFFCINLIVLVVVGGVWSFSYQTFRDIVERYRKELIRSNPSMSAGDNI